MTRRNFRHASLPTFLLLGVFPLLTAAGPASVPTPLLAQVTQLQPGQAPQLPGNSVGVQAPAMPPVQIVLEAGTGRMVQLPRAASTVLAADRRACAGCFTDQPVHDWCGGRPHDSHCYQ